MKQSVVESVEKFISRTDFGYHVDGAWCQGRDEVEEYLKDNCGHIFDLAIEVLGYCEIDDVKYTNIEDWIAHVLAQEEEEVERKDDMIIIQERCDNCGGLVHLNTDLFSGNKYYACDDCGEIV